MKYVAKQSIPLKNKTFKKGDIIESESTEGKYLDLTNINFFSEWKEPKYKVNDEVIILGEIYRIIEVSVDGNYMYKTTNGKIVSFNDNTKNIKTPTKFFFINSNGTIVPDYEERKSLKKDGLDYKKKTGNYFHTKKEAQIWKDNLLNSINK